jgi:hypothetical protein
MESSASLVTASLCFLDRGSNICGVYKVNNPLALKRYGMEKEQPSQEEVRCPNRAVFKGKLMLSIDI